MTIFGIIDKLQNPELTAKEARRLIQQAIVISRKDPTLSIPAKGLYLRCNTELTEMLERAEISPDQMSIQKAIKAVDSSKLNDQLTDMQRLEKLIELGK